MGNVEEAIVDALSPVIQSIVSDAITDLLHPEFGSIWMPGGLIEQQRKEAVEEYKKSLTGKTGQDFADKPDGVDCSEHEHYWCQHKPDGVRLTDVEVAERMAAVSDEAVRVAEDVWSEDEPTLAEYELTERILTARASTAQAEADALRKAADAMPAWGNSGGLEFAQDWLRERADRLSTAQDEAGEVARLRAVEALLAKWERIGEPKVGSPAAELRAALGQA